MRFRIIFFEITTKVLVFNVITAPIAFPILRLEYTLYITTHFFCLHHLIEILHY